MKLKSLLSVTVTLAFFSTTSFAVEFDKPILAKVIIPKAADHAETIKYVHLMNLKLTPAERHKLMTLTSFNPNLVLHTKDLPPKADVGMNNTPVLDQGIWGTCVTFANTAAVDALLGKGDYVSQLCSLELGQYLKQHSYYSSGWMGSWGETVLNELIQFGIVNTSTQKSKTCGGLTDYPTYSLNNGKPMPLDDYHVISEDIKDNIYYRPFMTFADRLSWGKDIDENSAVILEHVKEAIVNKPDPSDPASAGRVTFATMLPVDYCSAGACATYHVQYDTWALTDAIKNDPNPDLGEHEMIITGYDDNAIVTDNEGKQHQGLLILRNSFGASAGDNGNYYMTYEFFRQYVIEAQEVTWSSGN